MDYSVGRLALSFFSATIAVLIAQLFAKIKWTYILIAFAVLIVFLRATFSSFHLKIIGQSIFLGCTLSLSFYILKFANYPITQFGYYLVTLSLFHFCEFISIAFTNPSEINANSFIINHSPQYHISLILSWIEFFAECYFVSDLKRFHAISIVGLCLCLFGDSLRKLAIFTAKLSFNHIVQATKHDDHVLITHGVYSYCRHPAYLGWFIWAISTQILLQNPVCFIIYMIIIWYFMYTRITDEEYYLISFFGDQYIEYQEKVHSGIPFCSGYVIGNQEI